MTGGDSRHGGSRLSPAPGLHACVSHWWCGGTRHGPAIGFPSSTDSAWPPETHGGSRPGSVSGWDENLDRQWLVADRAGVHRPATGRAHARHLGRLEDRRSAVCELADTPEASAGADLRPNGEIASRRAILDIAVGKTKNQDRRVGHAKTVPGPADDALGRFPCIDALNAAGSEHSQELATSLRRLLPSGLAATPPR